MIERCIICNRRTCSHDSRLRYLSREPELGPVETTTGEAMRQLALGTLTRQFERLMARSKERDFDGIEAGAMRATGEALEALQRMAPASALIEPRGEAVELAG